MLCRERRTLPVASFFDQHNKRWVRKRRKIRRVIKSIKENSNAQCLSSGIREREVAVGSVLQGMTDTFYPCLGMVETDGESKILTEGESFCQESNKSIDVACENQLLEEDVTIVQGVQKTDEEETVNSFDLGCKVPGGFQRIERNSFKKIKPTSTHGIEGQSSTEGVQEEKKEKAEILHSKGGLADVLAYHILSEPGSENELTSLKEKAAALACENSEKKSTAVLSNLESKGLKDVLTEWTAIASRLRARVAGLQKRLRSQEQMFQSTLTTKNREIACLEEALGVLTHELTASTAALEALDKRLKSVENLSRRHPTAVKKKNQESRSIRQLMTCQRIPRDRQLIVRSSGQPTITSRMVRPAQSQCERPCCCCVWKEEDALKVETSRPSSRDFHGTEPFQDTPVFPSVSVVVDFNLDMSRSSKTAVSFDAKAEHGCATTYVDPVERDPHIKRSNHSRTPRLEEHNRVVEFSSPASLNVAAALDEPREQRQKTAQTSTKLRRPVVPSLCIEAAVAARNRLQSTSGRALNDSSARGLLDKDHNLCLSKRPASTVALGERLRDFLNTAASYRPGDYLRESFHYWTPRDCNICAVLPCSMACLSKPHGDTENADIRLGSEVSYSSRKCFEAPADMLVSEDRFAVFACDWIGPSKHEVIQEIRTCLSHRVTAPKPASVLTDVVAWVRLAFYQSLIVSVKARRGGRCTFRPSSISGEEVTNLVTRGSYVWNMACVVDSDLLKQSIDDVIETAEGTWAATTRVRGGEEQWGGGYPLSPVPDLSGSLLHPTRDVLVNSIEYMALTTRKGRRTTVVLCCGIGRSSACGARRPISSKVEDKFSVEPGVTPDDHVSAIDELYVFPSDAITLRDDEGSQRDEFKKTIVIKAVPLKRFLDLSHIMPEGSELDIIVDGGGAGSELLRELTSPSTEPLMRTEKSGALTYGAQTSEVPYERLWEAVEPPRSSRAQCLRFQAFEAASLIARRDTPKGGVVSIKVCRVPASAVKDSNRVGGFDKFCSGKQMSLELEPLESQIFSSNGLSFLPLAKEVMLEKIQDVIQSAFPRFGTETVFF